MQARRTALIGLSLLSLAAGACASESDEAFIDEGQADQNGSCDGWLRSWVDLYWVDDLDWFETPEIDEAGTYLGLNDRESSPQNLPGLTDEEGTYLTGSGFMNDEDDSDWYAIRVEDSAGFGDDDMQVSFQLYDIPSVRRVMACGIFRTDNGVTSEDKCITMDATLGRSEVSPLVDVFAGATGRDDSGTLYIQVTALDDACFRYSFDVLTHREE